MGIFSPEGAFGGRLLKHHMFGRAFVNPEKKTTVFDASSAPATRLVTGHRLKIEWVA